MTTVADTSKVKNALASRTQKAPAKKAGTLIDLIKRMEPELKRALPGQLSVERFSRVAMTAIRTNPKLQACSPESFIAAMMQSAQLGLEPNTPLGQAYLIPYGDEVQFQLGYQGMLTLAYRTGEYQSIYAYAVYANDEFEYELGLEEKLIHKPAKKPEGEPIYYYAVYHLQNGGRGFVVMSREQIEAHRDKYSPSATKGRHSPWVTDFDSMAKKTVLKQLLKYAPKSVEFASQLSTDETVKTEIAEDMTEVMPIYDEANIIDADVTYMDEQEEPRKREEEK